jgi:hypothetical protein
MKQRLVLFRSRIRSLGAPLRVVLGFFGFLEGVEQ